MADHFSYASVHIYLKRDHGDPREKMCAECGERRADEWAYDHLDPEEVMDEKRGHAYSLKAEHYRPLCRSCHRRADFGDTCPHGHPRTPDNVYLYRGWRMCRECRLINMRNYHERRRKKA